MAIEIPQQYKDGYVNFQLDNVKVRWAHIYKPDTQFGKNEWCIELLLDDETADTMKEVGFNVVDKKDGTKNVLKPKRQFLTKSGQEQKPPRVVGPDNKPFTEEVGNGSICNLQLSARAWNVAGGWKLGCYLEAVQVVKHVERGGSGFKDLTEEASEEL